MHIFSIYLDSTVFSYGSASFLEYIIENDFTGSLLISIYFYFIEVISTFSCLTICCLNQGLQYLVL